MIKIIKVATQKIIPVILSIGIMMHGLCVVEAKAFDLKYTSNNISVSGVAEYDLVGTKVSVLVTKSTSDWTEESDWISGDDSEVVYYDEMAVDTDKVYKFNFTVPKSGVYNVIISSKTGRIKTLKIVVLDSPKNQNLLIRLADAMTVEEVKNILIGNLSDFGVFAFSDVDITDNVAKLLFDKISKCGALNTDKTTLDIERAILADKINSGEIINISNFSNLNLSHEKVLEYCIESIANKVFENVKKRKITAINDFDRTVYEETVVVLANSKYNENILKEMLNEYKNELNLNKNVDSSMAKAVLNRGGFANCPEVVEFVNNYKADDNKGNTSSGSSFGGGGRLGSTGSNYNGTEIVTDLKTIDKPQEIDVFDDISDVDWAKNAITELYKEKIINGKEEKLFCPNEYITREEFAKMLMLAFEVRLVDDQCPFEDVSTSDWSYDYVRTAYLAGIVNGISEKIFGKEINITRQDLCTMVYRVFEIGNKNIETGLQTEFKDSYVIDDYAKDATMFLKDKNILTGDENGYFNPLNNATRAEAAKIVFEARNLYMQSR